MEKICTPAGTTSWLSSPEQVREIATTLPAIDEAGFRERYNAIDAKEYGSLLSEQDFEYTWSWFQGVRKFYLYAALEGRYVLFTADQQPGSGVPIG